MEEDRTAGRRIDFANQLRGIAALSVVWLHLGVHYWHGKGFVFSTVGITTPPEGQPPPWWASVSSLVQTAGTGRNYFDFGIFGVALFFLISGFVIPISLRKLGRAKFLLARVVRIYPVYLVSLGVWVLCWALVRSLSLGEGRPDISWASIALQATLVGDFFGLPSFDLVSWTLQVELKFYLVAALLYGTLRRGRRAGVYAFALFVLALAVFRWYIGKHPFPWMHGNGYLFTANQILVHLGFVVYIFCGYLYALFWQGAMGKGKLLAGLFSLEGVALLTLLSCGVKGRALVPFFINQTLALSCFAMAMRLGSPGGVFHRLLDGLARISYPMYTTHLIVGWATLSLLDILGAPPVVSQVSGFVLVALVAGLVHLWVEQPSQRLIERLGAHRAGRGMAHPGSGRERGWTETRGDGVARWR